ncbi:MAG: glycosyltransferase [Promethearchaeota archaeon]
MQLFRDLVVATFLYIGFLKMHAKKVNPSRKIVWIGRFRGYSGFATSTREYFLSILPYFHKLYIAPLEVLKENDPLKQYLVPLPLEDTELKIINHLPTTDPEAEVYFSVFEYNRIPDSWIPIFNQARLIMTQSNFCKQIFSQFIDDPSKIRVVPYILPKNFRGDGPKIRYFPEDIFVFGSVFEWVPRKVPERTIKAFVEEFSSNEPVRLVLKASHPQGKNVKELVSNITKDERIIVIEDIIEDISAFYRGLDAYISCTAGEGWGQTLTEAMACGIPTIASRHSGNLDFMNDENSFLVDVHDWSPSNPNPSFMWKLPKISGIKKTMRYIYEHKGSPSIQKKIKNALSTTSKLTHEAIGPKIRDYLISVL